MDRLLTVDDVAQILRVTSKTVRVWARNGTLMPVRMSRRRVLFDPEDLKRMIGRKKSPVKAVKQ